MRKPKPKLPGLPLHSQLACAVTDYDRKQSTKKFHNIWALGHYLKGCDQVCALVDRHNLSVEDASCTCFIDRLQSHVLKFLGYNIADRETIRNGKPEYRNLRDSLED